MRVYGDVYSGNCYKLKLLLTQLGRAHEWVHVDVVKGQSRTPAFLARNPNGKIPLLELEDGRTLAESNAILHYLATGTAFLATESFAHAQMLQWMFFEQYSHEPQIAVARYIVRYLGRPAAQEERLQKTYEPGRRALGVMEQQLAREPWFAGGRYSIADIALYAYTHVAHEGGFDLAPFPAIQAWLGRVREQPRHITMDEAAKSG